MARWSEELRVHLPVQHASQACCTVLEYYEWKIESVDQHRLAAKENWTKALGGSQATYGRAHLEILLAPVDESETLVTLNARGKGVGPGARFYLKDRLALLGADIAGAGEPSADSGPSGQSKAVSDAPASDPVEQIRQLSELRDAGVLTDEEFEAKKADLLGRI